MNRLVLFGLLVLMQVNSSCSNSSPHSSHQAKPTQSSRCPVCGMSVEEYPNFICRIELKDGVVLSFDGPKDMFTYYQNPGKYNPGKKAEIASVTVSDYYSLGRIDGSKAYFVTGSNVLGPMGKELIAFERDEDAQEFMIDHSGKALLRFKDVTPELIRELTE